jgi:class 3 adenylate cyclase
MFTDIVGFTALMGASEEKALRFRRINREIHQQRIEAAGGTWLKEMGDGTMASFASYHDPHMDRIKREYPAFVEALNNLKLPPKLDLEGVIKL